MNTWTINPNYISVAFQNFFFIFLCSCSWLKHCATSRKGGFDSRCWFSDFTLTSCFWFHYVSRIDSTSIRNEYQASSLVGKVGRCVGLTHLSPCANCQISWEPQSSGALSAYLGLYTDSFCANGCKKLHQHA